MNRRELLSNAGAGGALGFIAALVVAAPGCMPKPATAAEADSSAVHAAVARHRALVQLDETMFSDVGKPIAPAAEISASEANMATAWMALMAAPCWSIEDVRAKVDYILNGTIGERDFLLNDLTGPDGSETFAPDNCLPVFLRSLMGVVA